MAIPKILEHERKLKNIQDGLGELSIKEGDNTTASGQGSHAEGYVALAEGDYSHAEGYETEARRDYSHAEGSGTTAYGQSSHAEGSGTTAYGDYSHAEGSGTTPYGQSSHAEGTSTITYGQSSHAEGSNTTAAGDYSHAEGYKTAAPSSYQHVQGINNIPDVVSKYAHIVGNGDLEDLQSNAHTLDWNGNAWFAGDVYVGSDSGTDKDDGSKKLATEEYVDNSGGTFYAIYGTTTYQEIVDAFNAGKTCKALYSNETSYKYIFDLVTRPTSSNPTLYFISDHGNYTGSITTQAAAIYIDSSSSWAFSLSGTKKHISAAIYSVGVTSPISSDTAYYRPIRVSTAAPTASDGRTGDIWVVYSNE